jgi:hypothetical protein
MGTPSLLVAPDRELLAEVKPERRSRGAEEDPCTGSN